MKDTANQRKTEKTRKRRKMDRRQMTGTDSA